MAPLTRYIGRSLLRLNLLALLALLALALAIGAGVRALPAAGSPSQSDSAAPDRPARPLIQLSDFDLPADPVFYSERDDQYLLGSYGG